MLSPIRRTRNLLKLQAVSAHIRSLNSQDPKFAENFKKDPVGIMEQFGISRAQAVEIIACDLGVDIAKMDCVCTGCCCTGCSYSGKNVYDLPSLPAIGNIAAWKALVKTR